MRLRKCELQPHGAGEETGDEEKAERGHDIADADRGVVHGLEPSKKAGRFPPDELQLRSLFAFGVGQFLGLKRSWHHRKVSR